VADTEDSTSEDEGGEGLMSEDDEGKKGEDEGWGKDEDGNRDEEDFIEIVVEGMPFGAFVGTGMRDFFWCVGRAGLGKTGLGRAGSGILCG